MTFLRKSEWNTPSWWESVTAPGPNTAIVLPPTSTWIMLVLEKGDFEISAPPATQHQSYTCHGRAPPWSGHSPTKMRDTETHISGSFLNHESHTSWEGTKLRVYHPCRLIQCKDNVIGFWQWKLLCLSLGVYSLKYAFLMPDVTLKINMKLFSMSTLPKVVEE